MASMKSMINVVLDVGPTMTQPVGSESDRVTTKLGLAKGVIGHFFLQRMMASKTVELGVVTFGDNVTKNFVNTSQKGGYENVRELVKIAKPSKETLSTVSQISPGRFTADLIDGIVVGQDALVRINEGKAFNRIMVLMTDGETPVDGIESLEDIIPRMKELKNFALYIAMIGKATSTSSVVKQENAKLLASLAENTGGRFLEIGELIESVHLLSAGLGLSSRPVLSKTTLTLTGEVHVPCTYFNPVSAATLPTLKKRPRPAAGDDDAIPVAMKRDTSYRDAEHEDIEFAPEERVKGYKYGTQYVPVSSADEESFKIRGPPGVTVIGFIPATQIPRHHFLDTPMVLSPAVDNSGATRLFSALVHTLRSEGKVGLARFVKRENSDPFLAVLMPLAEGEEGSAQSLLAHRLPCAEDVRDYSFPSLVTFASEAQVRKDSTKRTQVAAMAAYLQAISVQTPTLAQLTPANPTYQGVYAEVHRRLLNASAEQMVPLGDTLVMPSPRSDPALLKSLMNAFPLQKVVRSSNKKRKLFWSEMAVNSSSTAAAADNDEDDADEDEAKKRRLDSQEAAQLTHALGAQYKQQQVDMEVAESKDAEEVVLPDLPSFTMGSVMPVEDFTALETLLFAHAFPEAYRSERLREAMQTMVKIADRNVTVGASLPGYQRAVECLRVLRAASVRVQDCATFNGFLQMPCKTVHSRGRHMRFWQLLQEAKLLPVSTDEVSTSTISAAAAKAFFGPAGGGSSAASSQKSASSQQCSVPRAVPADEEDEAAFFSPWK